MQCTRPTAHIQLEKRKLKVQKRHVSPSQLAAIFKYLPAERKTEIECA
jgi:hypothetical protein